MSKEIKGTSYVLAAGIAWALSGISGQYLMARGFPPLLLTNIRILLAGIFLTLLAYHRAKDKFLDALKNKRDLLAIFCFAIFGLLCNQFSYLFAIRETNAGTATVLQYICPVFVLAYSCLKDRTLPTLVEILATFFAMLGTFLIATHGQLNSLSMTPAGLFWGIFSAVTYALYILLPMRLIGRYGSLVVIGLSMVLAGVSLLPVSGFVGYAWSLDGQILLAFFGLVAVGTIFTYTVFLKGASLIGPVKSSLYASIEPVAAVIFAALMMNEHFYPIDILGMTLILLAVLLLSLKDLFLQKKKGFL